MARFQHFILKYFSVWFTHTWPFTSKTTRLLNLSVRSCMVGLTFSPIVEVCGAFANFFLLSIKIVNDRILGTFDGWLADIADWNNLPLCASADNRKIWEATDETWKWSGEFEAEMWCWWRKEILNLACYNSHRLLHKTVFAVASFSKVLGVLAIKLLDHQIVFL